MSKFTFIQRSHDLGKIQHIAREVLSETPNNQLKGIKHSQMGRSKFSPSKKGSPSAGGGSSSRESKSDFYAAHIDADAIAEGMYTGTLRVNPGKKTEAYVRMV